MNKRINLNIEHLTRIEGHGNIVVKANDGVIEKIEWQIPEAPRFFEAMVRGQSWQDIQSIVSRVCGICSISHSLVAIKAIESAMGIKVSLQTENLRILTHYSEILQSHILHIGYLVSPDLVGTKSFVPLVENHYELLETIIKIRKVANTWANILAGRTTHPITLIPGGFSKLPSERELLQLKTELAGIVPEIEKLSEYLLGHLDKLPAFERETEYVALKYPDRYDFYHGNIGNSDTDETFAVEKFETVINEYISPQSTAKWARWHRDEYAVGALARFNLNSAHLAPKALEVADAFGLNPICINPFMNTIAQLVETVHIVADAQKLIDELLDAGIRRENPGIKPKAGIGVACIEAPRGTLFHRYEFDEKGICIAANMIIPTNQNHGNIQKDIETFVPRIMKLNESTIKFLLEMLIRAYDPCLSCSTH